MGTILITGGHSGIGLECAKRLVDKPGHTLVLAGRDLERVEPVARQLRTRGVEVKTLQLDVASLASVRTGAARCRAMLDKNEIDGLEAILCNAGAQFMGPVTYSPDGYENTFATNCLGHFLLVELLIDRLAESGRVVFTASGTHDPKTADGKVVGKAAEPDALVLAHEGKGGGKPLSTGVRYTSSKLCDILYAYELDRRLRRANSSIVSIAFDPGSVAGTGLLRTHPKPLQVLAKTGLMKWVMRRMGITMSSAEFSGAALARLCADPTYASESGKYFQAKDNRLTEQRSSTKSYDTAAAAKLWRDSETLVYLHHEERSALLSMG
ncbi:SDR family NAD(P)-dependent oxidoreductase (plasmid) [Lichenicola cladoniae]|uniref:SDR family NAD(P)-dependent oxidoreductase n=1 Tax=Lichenicola cladoniae TaxID=1484109 RepID=A0A6M8HZ76_9PROT|nr:SDR family NAD(P)-dependent oxidoreductase [Lichenicola cladoniae]NPD69576.1 SDR family NAD(P)-dependent oxidoreductase [Acetobacteraceae bacterium]QKE93455.1 SDR family NAD(P)-dependent oxidoreductase [Lichenicola cladoniae]